MQFRLHKIIIVFVLALTLLSCSNTKYLRNNEVLFKRSKIVIDNKKDIKLSRSVIDELNEVLYPQANTKIFGLKIPLYFYNIAGNPTKKQWFKRYLKNKLGEPPVLYNEKQSNEVAELINNRLEINGYFNSRIQIEPVIKNHKAEVFYKVTLNKPYKIDTVIYNVNDSVIRKIVQNAKNESLLNKGDIYSLNKLIDERRRINQKIRNKGYMFFRPDFLKFVADSTNGEIKLSLKLKEKIPEEYKQTYTIDSVIFAIPDNVLDDTIKPGKLEKNEDVYYFDKHNKFKPHKILKNNFFHKDSLYSDEAYKLTLSYLYGLNIISLSNINLSVSDTGQQKLLCKINVLTSTNNSLQTKLTAFTRTNGFAGPSLGVTFSNKNLFKGGEHFSLTFESGFEKQFTKEKQSVDYILRFDVRAKIQFPNFTPGINRFTRKSISLPYSFVEAGTQFLNYKPSMDIYQNNLKYGYRWKPHERLQWEFNIVSFIFQRQDIKDGFTYEDIIDLPYVTYGLENQFSLGSDISLISENRKKSKTRNEYYFKTKLDLAGNLMYAYLNAFDKYNSDEAYEIFGVPFAQYIRTEFDIRYYRRIKENNYFANRFLAYLSIPYGNSQELPFFKKYFVGGPNSVRGFTTGSFGPGTFRSPNEIADIRVSNGDIRLELNTEYRFKIVGYLFGAIFVDAGNVWLKNEDTLRPGGEFRFNRFYKEFAVSSGAGLRLDFNIVAIRLDYGQPLRKPYLPDGQRWIFDAPADSWQTYYGVFHFSIDYPF